MKKILIYSQSTIVKDPRVYKQVARLSREYDVITIGYGFVDLTNVQSYDLHNWVIKKPAESFIKKICNAFIEKRLSYALVFNISRTLPAWFPLVRTSIKNFLIVNGKYSRTLKKIVNETTIDLIIANDFTALPVCCAVAKSRKLKLLYDAHEYTLGQSSNDQEWVKKKLPYIRYALKKYLPKCDRMTTVCASIAEEYQRTFSIPLPAVIKNASPYKDLSPEKRNDGKIKLVHHGLALRQRAIEDMIKTVELLDDRFELYFYLVFKDMEYYAELKKLALPLGRVFFMDPVPMDLIPSTLNMYDIGLYILPPVNFNQLHALPNKIFEFIQARLAVAIAPSPEMSEIVKKYQLGVIADDFEPESMARAIGSLDEDCIQRYKQNSHSCAKELSAEVEIEKLAVIVEELINSN
jgi:glycosyltransferase involved in cell wall biosynthesis